MKKIIIVLLMLNSLFTFSYAKMQDPQCDNSLLEVEGHLETRDQYLNTSLNYMFPYGNSRVASITLSMNSKSYHFETSRAQYSNVKINIPASSGVQEITGTCYLLVSNDNQSDNQKLVLSSLLCKATHPGIGVKDYSSNFVAKSFKAFAVISVSDNVSHSLLMRKIQKGITIQASQHVQILRCNSNNYLTDSYKLRWVEGGRVVDHIYYTERWDAFQLFQKNFEGY